MSKNKVCLFGKVAQFKVQFDSVALSTRDSILFGPVSPKQWTLSAFFPVRYPRHASKLTLHPKPQLNPYFS